jgi:putative PIN family toxin of toxin-antitoxin system
VRGEKSSVVPRVVLDANVLVSGAISRGAPAQLLQAGEAGEIELVVSPLLLAEVAEVLRRSKFRRYISEAEADEFVDRIRRIAILIEDPALPEPLPFRPEGQLPGSARAHG